MDSEDPEISTGGTEVISAQDWAQAGEQKLSPREPPLPRPVHEGEAPEILIT